MRSLLKHYQPPGTSPGTLRAARGETGPARVRVLRHVEGRWHDEEIVDPGTLARATDGLVWVHVIGLGDVAVLQRIGDAFKLHPLALEDAVHLGQRPKVEDYAEHAFSVFQFPYIDAGRVAMRQVSLFFNARFVVTLQPGGADLLENVRARLLRVGAAAASERGAGYLAYTIMDYIVDSAFPLLEEFGEGIEALEDAIVRRPGRKENLQTVHRLRRDLLQLRRVFWPQREVFAHLMREEARFDAATHPYLRDLYDHIVQILDVVESYRDMVASLLDLYISGLSMRLNDIVRILTVIATLFMPLTFLVGVYGMNFDRSSPWNMPELGWEYGYLMLWVLMVAITAGLLLFFRRKGWI